MAFPFVIGVTGYAQHGKDTVGQRLVDRWGFKRFAFADPLKSLALTLDPFIPGRGVEPYERLSAVVNQGGWEFAKARPEVRRFLQVLGTEGVRNHLGDDSWVKACGKAFLEDGADKVVITDVRFPNEADYIRKCGGVLVKVIRLNYDGTTFDNGLGTNHPSERNIAGLVADFNLVAVTGEMSDLLAKVDAIAAHLEEGFRPAARGLHVPAELLAPADTGPAVDAVGVPFGGRGKSEAVDDAIVTTAYEVSDYHNDGLTDCE